MEREPRRCLGRAMGWGTALARPLPMRGHVEGQLQVASSPSLLTSDRHAAPCLGPPPERRTTPQPHHGRSGYPNFISRCISVAKPIRCERFLPQHFIIKNFHDNDKFVTVSVEIFVTKITVTNVYFFTIVICFWRSFGGRVGNRKFDN